MKHTHKSVEALRVEMHRLDKINPRSEAAHDAWRKWALAFAELHELNKAAALKTEDAVAGGRS